jgi:hypothetical protein
LTRRVERGPDKGTSQRSQRVPPEPALTLNPFETLSKTGIDPRVISKSRGKSLLGRHRGQNSIDKDEIISSSVFEKIKKAFRGIVG